MDTRPKSKYARKRDYLKSYNRKTEAEPDAKKGTRVWGFEFPMGEKPWARGQQKRAGR